MRRALTTAAVLLALGGAGFGWTIARRLTAPVGPRRRDLTIHDIEQDGDQMLVVLDRTQKTQSTGIYSLLFPDGGWLQLSDEIHDRGADRIARMVTGIPSGFVPAIGTHASLSGIYFATPEDAGFTAHDVTIPGPAGGSPAWLVDGTTQPATWAIHLHGLGSPRAGTLRGARVAYDLGYTSLIPSYRNDGDGPTIAHRRSTLGFTEVLEAESAIDFAVAHGAHRIVLFGWSMGAVITQQLLERSRHAGTITAIVLESPVLDWPATIRANCARAGLPSWTGWLALPWLTLAPLCRWVGLPTPLPLLSSARRAREGSGVPTLVLQGSADDSVPPGIVHRIADRRPDEVEMHVFDAGHTMTWNSDPERWRTTVASWLTRHVGQTRDPAE